MTIWIGGQFLAIVVAALRIPLAARYPEPAEGLAPELILATQFILLALLFPPLLGNFKAAMLTIASGIVFLQLSGLLGATPVSALIGASGLFVLWAVGLWIIRGAVTAAVPTSVAAAIVSTTIVGGAMLGYLSAEFGPADPVAPPAFSHFFPLAGSIGLISGKTLGFRPWVLPMIVVFVGIAAHFARRVRRRMPVYPQGFSPIEVDKPIS